MSIEDNIYSRLANDSGVADLVGTGSPPTDNARVYGNLLPQDVAMPAVSFSRVSTRPLVGLGSSGGKTNLRVQVDSWAETYEGAKALAAAVRSAMEGSTTNFKAMWLNEFDLYEDDPKVHHISQDFSVWA